MVDIEQFTIRFMLYKPNDVATLVKHNIDETYFFNTVARSLVKIIFDYYKKYGKGITYSAFTLALKNIGFDQNEMQKYIDLQSTEDLVDTDPVWIAEELLKHKKQYILRHGIEKIIESIEDVNDAESKLSKLTQKISKLTIKEDLTTHLNNDVPQLLQEYKTPKNQKKIFTGYREFDETLHGLTPGWLFLLVSRPKVGKSRLMINLAVNMAKQGHNIIIFSLEMPQEEYNTLILSCASGVAYPHIRDHTLTTGEVTQLEKTAKEMQNWGKITVIDTLGPVPPEYIKAKIEDEESVFGIDYDVCIVDYAGMMRVLDKNVPDWLQQGQIAEELRAIARQKELVMLTAVQRKQEAVKKKTKSDDITGKGEDIYRSDIWFQTADVVSILHLPEDKERAIQQLDVKIISRYAETTSFELFKDFLITKVYSTRKGGEFHHAI